MEFFARHGYPHEVVTDNGLQFVSTSMERFLKECGIRHIKASPYYPKKEATQVGNYFVQHLPRNPSMFSGEDGEDPLTWLKGYKRVAKHNHWDETLCLANVYFYLNGTALKWFENNEETIRNWEEFTTQLEMRSLRLLAEKKLKIRAQLKGESTEFYIQDVLRLCKEVDLQMSEGDKISHLMKGIVEELYQALLPRDINNTDQFVSEYRRIEALHRRRVTPAKYERLPNVASLDVCDDNTNLSSMIRKIVREEVQRALAAPREEPRIANIEDMPIPVPIAAFEKVGMDLLGRFPTSMCGNRWIIVCTDYLTKFAITKLYRQVNQ
ncbi:ASPRV1 [Cordylochernes scorpioides]|uniref:ASPRV1 n=1 Tax=Cordylochernes scorpioides TaxID=51811 RepID=A0ABY6LRR7_9ARAC|nr:ASPRV1 [Cordylochernes scorpioides]